MVPSERKASSKGPTKVSPRDVCRQDLLSGLIHEYHGRAAGSNLDFRPPRAVSSRAAVALRGRSGSQLSPRDVADT